MAPASGNQEGAEAESLSCLYNPGILSVFSCLLCSVYCTCSCTHFWLLYIMHPHKFYMWWHMTCFLYLCYICLCSVLIPSFYRLLMRQADFQWGVPDFWCQNQTCLRILPLNFKSEMHLPELWKKRSQYLVRQTCQLWLCKNGSSRHIYSRVTGAALENLAWG